MHVLHIFNEITFSGAEIMYADAAPLFQQQGIDMTAVNTAQKQGSYIPVFEKAGIKVLNQPLSGGYKSPLVLWRYFRKVYSFIKTEKVDIVHVHRSDVFWYYAIAAAMAGKKTIVTAHNVFKNRKITWLKAYLERLTARKLFRTTFQAISKSVYKNELNYYKNPSVWINNWYNPERFFPAAANEKKELRKTLGIKEDDLVIVSAGGCSHVKNHGAILDALALVQKKYACTYLHLGTGSLEKEEIKKTADLQLQQQVQFLGNRLNVRDYLVASDVYIMSSLYEGISIASIEAMACGIPVILYNVPGLWDLIENDNNGFLISQDPAIIAEKLAVFKTDPACAAEKGRNGHLFATSTFSLSDRVMDIIRLYNN